MHRKGAEKRDARLSIRIPRTLKQTITRYAEEDQRTVADAVILMLETSVEIERLRRLNAGKAPHEWKKIGEAFARLLANSLGSKQPRRTARRTRDGETARRRRV